MNQDATDNSLPKPQMDQHLQPFPSFPASETSPKTQRNQHGQSHPNVVSSVDNETDMDVDATSSLSPLISQYAAQHYLQKESSPVPVQETTVHIHHQTNTPVHNSPEHNSPVRNSAVHHSPVQDSHVHDSPVHKSPVHKTSVHHSPVHNSPVHNSPVHNLSSHNSPVHILLSLSTVPEQGSPVQDYNEEIQKSPPTTPSPLYDTSAPPLNLHLSSPDTPISLDPITPTEPKYDTSGGPSSSRACQFPLPPQSCSLESSPSKSPGFAVHAAGVNAFSATSTSHSRVSKPNVDLDDEAVPSPNVVELSDCEGTPPRRRPPYMPSMEENYVAKQLYKCKEIPAPTPICPLPQIQWDLFYKSISKFREAFHITPSNLSFSNNFLLQLAVPKHWTKTYHMVMLMHMLSVRHAELLQSQKFCFTTPYLTSGIQQIYPRFSRSRKKETFNWDNQLSDIVLMPGSKWMEDVTTVYTPMIWDDRHWVGLAINLDLGLVEILDPMPDLYTDKKVVRFMNPVLKCLPYLVKKLANYELTQFRKLEPFTWIRPKDIYRNERSGDCGPVSVKFMEMHALGDPEPTMSGITDKLVDAFRKQYILDLYKTVVLPAYYREPTIDTTSDIGD